MRTHPVCAEQYLSKYPWPTRFYHNPPYLSSKKDVLHSKNSLSIVQQPKSLQLELLYYPSAFPMKDQNLLLLIFYSIPRILRLPLITQQSIRKLFPQKEILPNSSKHPSTRLKTPFYNHNHLSHLNNQPKTIPRHRQTKILSFLSHRATLAIDIYKENLPNSLQKLESKILNSYEYDIKYPPHICQKIIITIYEFLRIKLHFKPTISHNSSIDIQNHQIYIKYLHERLWLEMRNVGL